MAYLNIRKFGGMGDEVLPKPFRYCFAVAGFLLLICLQKQAFDTASKQKTLSLS
jgi:hypothetical protein